MVDDPVREIPEGVHYMRAERLIPNRETLTEAHRMAAIRTARGGKGKSWDL
ncbi:MAG TPA: hypothetical protein VMY98_10045 [Anaerolineae bacterium]|nr:hypothetical protein [Anaerolineae bacterium]